MSQTLPTLPSSAFFLIVAYDIEQTTFEKFATLEEMVARAAKLAAAKMPVKTYMLEGRQLFLSQGDIRYVMREDPVSGLRWGPPVPLLPPVDLDALVPDLEGYLGTPESELALDLSRIPPDEEGEVEEDAPGNELTGPEGSPDPFG